jgi:tripartite-type tricarboxylate transporter receptor subunit TctC
MQMKSLTTAALGVAASLVMLVLLPGAAFAQTPFYKGKTLTVVLGTDAGGATSVRLRTITPYLGKYIPGNPKVIIEYMEGGGGRKAANHMFRTVRPDGLTLGSMTGTMVAQAVLGQTGILYDIDKFVYVGALDYINHQVFYTKKELGWDSLEKVLAAQGIRFGAQNVGHSGYIAGRFFAYLMGLKDPKFVTGYQGPEVDVALLRGEIDARSNLTTTILLRNPDWLEKKLMDFHAVVNIPKGVKHPHPGFASLRPLQSFVKSDKEDKLLEVFRAFRSSGSPFVLPSGTPPDRVNVLRQAIQKTFADPDLGREYKKLFQEDLLFLTADELERRIRVIPRDPEVNELVNKLSGAGPLPPR